MKKLASHSSLPVEIHPLHLRDSDNRYTRWMKISQPQSWTSCQQHTLLIKLVTLLKRIIPVPLSTAHIQIIFSLSVHGGGGYTSL